MRKRALLCAVISVAGLFASAREMSLLINGENVMKIPASITFDGDNAVLHFADGDEAYDMESVTMNFSPLSGVDEISAFAFRGVIGDKLVVEGVADDATVEIYDVNGIRRASAVAAHSRAEIDMSGIAPGVYVLRAGNDCVKFVKR